MPESDLPPVRCEFQSLEEPVRGTIFDQGGAPVPFEGWVAFAASISVVARRAAPPTPRFRRRTIADEPGWACACRRMGTGVDGS